MTERAMTGAAKDRRGFLRGAAAVVAAAGTGLLFSGSAGAAPVHPRAGRAASDQIPLPPIGAEVPCSMYAAGVPLRLNALGSLSLDFKGGINLRVRSSGAEGIVMEVLGFRVETDTSPSTPDNGSLIALALSEQTLTPLSTLSADGQLLVHLALTVSSLDKATREETVLGATDPSQYATLRSDNIKQFPPVNQPWRLHQPVSLYKPADSTAQGSPVGSLDAFDAIVNQAA